MPDEQAGVGVSDVASIKQQTPRRFGIDTGLAMNSKRSNRQREFYFSRSSATAAAAWTVGLVSFRACSSAGTAALAGPPISPSV